MQVWQFAILGLLFLLNGFFAMSEMAIVSSRPSRLQGLAEKNFRGARAALRLVGDPTGFLSTVQVGITLVGIFAGAYSGATLSEPLGEWFADIPSIAGYAHQAAIAVVVIGVTYFSLIIGELVPKRIALANAERIACFIAPAMTALAKIGAPIVWFLRISTEGLLRLTRVKRVAESTVSDEEVRSLLAEGAESGVFLEAERDIIESVIRVADRSVRAIMVPRPDVVWIDVEDSPKAILEEVLESGHSRFPASRGEVDEVIGVVHVKELLRQQDQTGAIDIGAALREPLFVDEHMPILRMLDRFKTSAVHMAIVLDEHGSFEGIVTPTDILTAIAGDLPEHEGDDEPDVVEREDGSLLLSGKMAIDDAERALSLSEMSEGEDFHTLAGFILHQLGRIPSTGESLEWQGWRFEVIDLDARRIDKVEARRIAGEPPVPDAQ
ncbi:MAG: hemolysin family protein [Alphaproteobacteria bacterium]